MNIKWLIIIFIILLLLIELSLKLFFSFGNPPLFIEDANYEYSFKPNQQLTRLGRKMTINEFGMRSNSLKKEDNVRILKFGDSVINGGLYIDQDSVATSILERWLNEKYSNIRVLNISSASWGPDNAYAYLRKHGNFGSRFFILVFGSHDFYDKMTFERRLGINPAFPDVKPWSAIHEVWNKFMAPWFWEKISGEYQPVIENISEASIQDTTINQGFNDFIDYASGNSTTLVFLLHPSLEEVNAHSYNIFGQKILALMVSRNVTIIRGLDFMDPSCYRDDIHPNEKGHIKIAQSLLPILDGYLSVSIFHQGQ